MYSLLRWDEDGSYNPRTIEEEKFSNFLDLCFRNATYFTLTEGTWFASKLKGLQSELEQYLIREKITPIWYGYDYTQAPKEDYCELKIFFYEANIALKDIILKYTSDVFFEKLNGVELRDSCADFQNLEDLCFFNEDSLIVSTISHELMISVFPPNKEFEEAMLKLGEWVYEDRLAERFF